MIKLPMLATGTNMTEQEERHNVAYATNVTKEITNVSKEITNDTTKDLEINEKPLQVLLYFTHSSEAYQPIVEKKVGLKAVNYHPTTNITNVSALVTQHFQLHGDSVDVLPTENIKDMKISGAYATIRPYLQQQLASKQYDLLLDLHRDSLKHERTRIVFNDTSYARVSFVVGAEHTNYKLNEAFAKAVSEDVNRMIPSISRGVIPKSGDNVDGVYNQDLSSHALLVELGGIENTEEEINRTIAILTKAISNVFENTKATNY